MKISELQQKNQAELLTFISEKRADLQKMRFGTAGAGTRNPHALRDTRREIAQALTVLNAQTKTA
jgi:ribosomal protein L29